MTKAEIDDIRKSAEAGYAINPRHALQLCDELEKAQKQYIDLLERFHRYGSDTNEKAQAVVERVKETKIQLETRDSVGAAWTYKSVIQMLENCLAPLKPDYAQMVDDDKTTLEGI